MRLIEINSKNKLYKRWNSLRRNKRKKIITIYISINNSKRGQKTRSSCVYLRNDKYYFIVIITFRSNLLISNLDKLFSWVNDTPKLHYRFFIIHAFIVIFIEIKIKIKRSFNIKISLINKRIRIFIKRSLQFFKNFRKL